MSRFDLARNSAKLEEESYLRIKNIVINSSFVNNYNLKYKGEGIIDDEEQRYNMSEKDYLFIEKKSELCALIAQIENPDNLVQHASSLMENSVDDLVTAPTTKVVGFHEFLSSPLGDDTSTDYSPSLRN